jgi:hypothetical protein
MKQGMILAAAALAALLPNGAAAQTAPVQATAIAQTPAHLALADELVVAAQVSQQQMKIIPQIVEMIMPMVVRGNEAHADELHTILSEEFTTIFRAQRVEMERVARDAYARNLTDQELRDVTAFYRTPSGKRLVEAMPAITSESMQAGQEIGRRAAIEAMPHILDRMRKASLKLPDSP